MAPPQTEIADI